MTRWRCLALSLAALPLCAATTWFEEVGVQPGPYPVGLRIVVQRDYSRRQSAGPDRSTPIPICIWYPAAVDASKAPMRLFSYLNFERESMTLRPPTYTRTVARTEIQRIARGAFAETLDDARADRILDLEMLARMDAPPAAGRFPVIVGGLETPRSTASIGEFLASRGYVVLTTPATDLTQDQMGTRTLVALETQTRNLEFLAAFAQSLPQADLSSVAAVGVNFNGMSTLTFAMRNAGVSAIVSIDGYEGKAGFVATMRSAPHFDPAVLQTPYLLFLQHEISPGPVVVLDDTIFDSLRSSRREAFAIEGLRHGHYVLNLLGGAAANPAQKRGLTFVLNRIGDWLDAHVKKVPEAISRLRSVPEGPVFLKKRQEAAIDPPSK